MKYLMSFSIICGLLLFDSTMINGQDGSAFFKGMPSRLNMNDVYANNPDASHINGHEFTLEIRIFPLDLGELGKEIYVISAPILDPPNNVNLDPSNPPFFDFLMLLITDETFQNTHVEFSLTDGKSGGQSISFISNASIPQEQWSQISVTYDGTSIKMYINGTFDVSVPWHYDIVSNSIGIYAGYSWNNFHLGDQYSGLLDEIRLWDRALLASEIQGYSNTTLVGNESGLAGYWPLDEVYRKEEGNLTPDLTQNENHFHVQYDIDFVESAYTNMSHNPTSAHITFEPTSIDFGILEPGQITDPQQIVFQNSNDRSAFGKLTADNSNIAFSYESLWIKKYALYYFVDPQAQAELSLKVMPLVNGDISGTFLLSDNNPDNPAQEIPYNLIAIPLQQLDVNNIAMWVLRNGRFAGDPLLSKNGGLNYPIGSNKYAIYSSGLWLGAKVNGEIRTGIASYGSEFEAGVIAAGEPANPSQLKYRVYKIEKGDTESNPDYAEWPVEMGAPVNPDGSPKHVGDQTLFCVYNDADPDNHFDGSNPLGVEVQQTSFGYASSALTNTEFMQFEIVNTSDEAWEDAYLSLWCDPDIGYYADDVVGVDTFRNLGYAYNGDTFDESTASIDGYGDTPPAVGFDILQGGLRNEPLNAFGYFTAYQEYPDGDPSSFEEYYNLMQGLLLDGTPRIDPITAEPTKFPVSGNPVSGDGWLDAQPEDRRFVVVTGPFDLDPNQSKNIFTAIIVGQGSNNIASVQDLFDRSDAVQMLFDEGSILGSAVESIVSETIESGGESVIDDVENSNTTIQVSAEEEEVQVELTSYSEEPPGVMPPNPETTASFGKSVEIVTLGDIAWPIRVKNYYSLKHLQETRILEKDIQGLGYWNGVRNDWTIYGENPADDYGRGNSGTVVDTQDVTIGETLYEGTVSTDAYHVGTVKILARPHYPEVRFEQSIEFVHSLALENFKNPDDKRKKQLTHLIEQAQHHFLENDFTGAIQILEDAVTNHLRVRGKQGNNVWIQDDENRQQLRGDIHDLAQLLKQQLAAPQAQRRTPDENHMIVNTPTKYQLAHNYPNPFNPFTTLQYGIPEDSNVQLVIYDVSGKKICTLVNTYQNAGWHQVQWNGRNEFGQTVSTGVYFYRLEAGEFMDVKKMVYMK
ncbi:MAG: T9SS type A sorting domain-containing protein [Candidatus Marinimicrobia bacterium]|nr:T9SS type A sorting domain-containing protein [Candidatus Neomarinimicrobiota bacterium]MCF7880198.1 T9SS type A sorting domain-containing protein [Candidatus Neomarinimicrobiota bacterium]